MCFSPSRHRLAREQRRLVVANCIAVQKTAFLKERIGTAKQVWPEARMAPPQNVGNLNGFCGDGITAPEELLHGPNIFPQALFWVLRPGRPARVGYVSCNLPAGTPLGTPCTNCSRDRNGCGRPSHVAAVPRMATGRTHSSTSASETPEMVLRRQGTFVTRDAKLPRPLLPE